MRDIIENMRGLALENLQQIQGHQKLQHDRHIKLPDQILFYQNQLERAKHLFFFLILWCIQSDTCNSLSSHHPSAIFSLMACSQQAL